MPSKAERTKDALDEVDAITARVRETFDRLRGLRASTDDPDEAGAEEERDELLADILDRSEEAQAVLASSLAGASASLPARIHGGDNEAAALAGVILRALAAHAQAEAIRGLMESPDLSQFVQVEEDETMPPEWDGGDDDRG